MKKRIGKKRRIAKIALILAVILGLGAVGGLFAAAGGSIVTVGEMVDIKTDFADYLVQDTRRIENDGYVGAIQYTVYFDKTKSEKVQAGYLTENPIVVYTINTCTTRYGTDSNKEIIESILGRGYVVVVLDYLNNANATGKALDYSGQEFRIGIRDGSYFDASATDSVFTAGGKYYENFLVPSGCNLKYKDVFFELDKHSADGTLEKIVENWNTDFRGTKGKVLIKWATGTTADTRKKVVTAADGTSPTWHNSDGSLNASGGLYTYVKYTEAESITDCVNQDGSPLDFNQYMHIVYPTNPSSPVPVSALACSNEYPTTMPSSTDIRAYSVGFLYEGYANVVFDYLWQPMARNTAYGYYDGNLNTTGAVTGDHMNYSLHIYNDKLVNTAAMRRIRYLALSESSTYRFDTESIAVYGNSKGGWFTFLGEEAVQGPLVNASDYPTTEALEAAIDLKLASFMPKRIFDGHNGETRYQAGKTSEITGGTYTGENAVFGGTLQPWLTYNGVEIESGAYVTYASNGDSCEDVTQGHGPIFSASHMYDTYNSQYGVSTTFANLARMLDIPSIHVEVPLGHMLTDGAEMNYGFDTYRAFIDFCNYYLKGSAVRVLYTNPVSDAPNVDITDGIVIKFVGGVGADEITKVVISDGTDALSGTWSSRFGDTEWTFTPDSIKGGAKYTITVPAGLVGSNGSATTESFTSSFTAADEAQTAVNSVTGTRGTYMYFTAPAGSGNETVLRFTVDNDAANIAELYALSGFDALSPDTSTVGELLGEINLRGIGSYEIDVTDYVKAHAGEEIALLLMAKKSAGSEAIKNYSFAANDSSFSVFSQASGAYGVAVGGAADALELKVLPKNFPSNSNIIESNYQNRTGVFSIKNLLGTAKLTKDDLGRQFTISLRLYDTTSRQITLRLNNCTNSSTYKTIDYDAVVVNVRTVANEWVDISIPYTVYELDYGFVGEQTKTFTIDASGVGESMAPFYIDDFTLTEHITGINVRTATLAERSVDDGAYKAPEGTKPVALYNGSVKVSEHNTLSAALSAYASGYTVKLMSDLTVTDSDSFSGLLTNTSVSAWNIDLNGYRLTSENKTKSPFMLINSSSAAKNTKTEISIYGGTVVLSDTPLIAYTGSSSSGSGKSVKVNLSDLYIRTAKGAMLTEVISKSNIEAGAKTNVQIALSGCNITILDNAHTKNALTILPDGTGDLSLSYTVMGGSYSLTSQRWVTIQSGTKSVSYVASGTEYTTLSMPSFYEENGASYFRDDGFVSFEIDREEGGYKLYTLYKNPNSTLYGIIPDEYLDEENYPFVAFDTTGKFVGASNALLTNNGIINTAKNHMNSAGNTYNWVNVADKSLGGYWAAGRVDTIILLRRDYVSDSESYDNFSQIKGEVTIDLGGHTITRNGAAALFGTSLKRWGTEASTNIFPSKISLKNGTLITNRAPIISFSASTFDGSKNEAQYKEFGFSFDGVTFKLGSEATATALLLTNSGLTNGNLADKTYVDLTNCTVDLATAAPSGSISLFDFNSTYIRNNVTVYGGEILSADMSTVTIGAFAGGTGSTLTFGKYDGEYTVLKIQNGQAPSDTFPAVSGESITFTDSGSTDDGFKIYTALVSGTPDPEPEPSPEPTDIVTEYGTIPAEYADANAYPFVAFDISKTGSEAWIGANANFHGTGSTAELMTGIINDAKNHMTNNVWDTSSQSYGSNERRVVILMRRDYALGSAEKYDNLAQIQGTLTIDLGGYTLSQTASSYALFVSCVKPWGGSGDARVFPTEITVKNGTISVKNNAVVDFSAWDAQNTTEIDEKPFTYNFNGVTFKLAQSNTTTRLVLSNSTHSSTPEATANTFVNFTDCIFDLKTVEPVNSITLFNFNFPYINNTVKLNGCELIANDMSKITLVSYASGVPSTLTFDKGTDEKLFALRLDGGTAPTDEFDTTLGKCVFVNVLSDSKIYRLTPKAVSDFGIKTNIALYSDLIFNIYLYPSDKLSEVTLGLDTYTREDISNLPTKNIDGTEYYVLSVNLAAKEALSDISLKVKFTLDDLSTLSGSYTLGLVKYVTSALDVIAADSTAAAEAERAVLCNILSYIRAAYSYWTVSDSDIAEIDALLGEGYDVANAPEFNMEELNPTAGSGIKGATFTLTATPAFKLYIEDGVSTNSFSFKLGGIEKSYKVEEDDTGVYCLINVYAYEITETLSYTVSGTAYSGSYNILAYYRSKLAEPADASLLTLVERFMKYCESAKEFKSLSPS